MFRLYPQAKLLWFRYAGEADSYAVFMPAVPYWNCPRYTAQLKPSKARQRK
jgi:hypothetical protein